MTVKLLSDCMNGIYQKRDIDLKQKGHLHAADEVKIQSTGCIPDDSLPVANRKNESDSVPQEWREQQSDGTEKIPQAKIRQRDGRKRPRYPPGRGRIPSTCTKNQLITSKRIKILLFLFCFFGVEGSSSQTDCRDFLTNCSQYTNNRYCEPDHDPDEHVNVTWLFLNCQKTCICSKLNGNATDDTDTYCKYYQHHPECLQRPPAERFRIKCPKTCFYSVTPSFLTSPQNQTIKGGSNLTLECSTISPPVNFTWVMNDVPIVPGKRMLVSSNSTTSMLTIIAASPSDQGQYYCNATNSNYQQGLQSQVGYVTIEEDGFLTSPKNQTIKEGSNLTLECSTNSPPVNFTWVMNDVPIVPGKRMLVNSNSTTSMLTIIAASPLDQGQYYCNATNSNYQQGLQSQVGYVTIEEDGPNTGLIIGITVGCVVVVLVVLLKLKKLKKLRNHKKAKDDKEVTTNLNSSD